MRARARACPFAGHGIELSRGHVYRRQGGKFIFLFSAPCFRVPLDDKAVDESPLVEKSRIQRLASSSSTLVCRMSIRTTHFRLFLEKYAISLDIKKGLNIKIKTHAM